jgi:hypothetical protein
MPGKRPESPMADVVPQEWTEEVLSEHAAGIVFDGDEYEADCVLCQKAQALGYFTHYGFDPLDNDGSPDA